jgi:hypothetical protein
MIQREVLSVMLGSSEKFKRGRYLERVNIDTASKSLDRRPQ